MVCTKKGFQIFANVVMTLLALCCVLPFILLISSSVTDEATLMKNGYAFIPETVNFRAYQYLFQSFGGIARAYGMTVIVTAIGTTINVCMTMFMGYLLSKQDLPGKGFLSFFIFFTMLFSGGMVPSYIIWSQYLHVGDTIFALICPNLLLGGYNVILMRTYFTTNVPQEILEAAEMDSCSEIGKLFHISIPLSKPMISTVALFSALAYWNDWINGIYYLPRRKELYTIQNVLNSMMNNVQFLKENTLDAASAQIVNQIPTQGVRMAIAVISVLPILMIYPFFQKAFVKGIVIGGVKG
ncbi:carbohydrate ABC transporter permease [uncultured Acetatifactor sp.]|mgnify:FL=1|uniref:carbohydrate ABC transporter permease n=1 Tax=uncultured Acetatifactor sp. TaxID=1671927 RepID=UPI002619EBD2|nr:carbohydrate ABC transporter permease [uncultured Acetatifactor sp.]